MTLSKTSRRKLQKEDTRRILLQTAYDLFAELGYSRTTMRLLAQRAGVGLGTIFKHFPDKPSLLVAAFQEDLGRVVEQAFQSMPPKGIGDQLVHITEKIYWFYAKNIHFSRMLIKEGLFLEGPPGQILDQQLFNFLGRISELINEAVQQGDLPEGTDPFKGAMAYGSFYFSGLIMGLKQPRFDPGAQSQWVRDLIDLFWAPPSNPPLSEGEGKGGGPSKRSKTERSIRKERLICN